MAANQLIVGPQVNSDGTNLITQRATKLGAGVVQELHGRYYEQAYRKNIFQVASQAVATTTVGLAVTYTGLVVANPPSSVVNLVLNKASIMQSVIQATQIEAYAIAFGFNKTTAVTLTTPAVAQSTFIGSGAVANGVAAISATLPTAPVYGIFVTNTATATQNPPCGVIDFEGSVILQPGAYALWVTPTQASVAGLWFSFQWEEVPI
jgi:hypothetical protein